MCEPTTIILVHGFMQDSRTWDDVRALLQEKYRVIAPNLEPLDSAHATLNDLASQVRFALPSDRRAVFVGYSMGGRVLQAYMRAYPETVQALVLESAGLGPESEPDRTALAGRNDAWSQKLAGAGSRSEVVDWWEGLPLFRTQRELGVETKRKLRAMRMSCDMQRMSWLARYAGAHTMPLAAQTRSELEVLPFPVCYVYGTRDSKYAAVARTFARSCVQTLPFDAGHNVHMEQPRAYADMLDQIAAAASDNHREEGRI